MKKKIAIIGKGTAGSLAFNHFANFGNFEVECYFDSSIKEQSVGEGAPLNLGRTLYESLGLEYEDDITKEDINDIKIYLKYKEITKLVLSI